MASPPNFRISTATPSGPTDLLNYSKNSQPTLPSLKVSTIYLNSRRLFCNNKLHKLGIIHILLMSTCAVLTTLLP
jgi:hypothetical protein